MSENTKILCCRISWMREYKSKDEKPFSYHRYILQGNVPYEALNFHCCDDGRYRGYVPVGGDAEDKFGKIDITRLGAPKDVNRVTGVIVVFCAPHETQGGLRVVGFYRNATVLKRPEISDRPDRTRITRVISNDAVLIPENDRVFSIPGRYDGGFGQSSLWYGLNEDHQLRNHVLDYVLDTSKLPDNQASVVEYRHRKIHERWEGRGANRGFIHEMGFRCEACGYAISEKDQPIWGSGFELHHLLPWAQMQKDEARELFPKDFAVLCSICHRAIHRSEFVADVQAFRTEVLDKRGV